MAGINSLTCGICLERFCTNVADQGDPVYLSACLHTFDENCIIRCTTKRVWGYDNTYRERARVYIAQWISFNTLFPPKWFINVERVKCPICHALSLWNERGVNRKVIEIIGEKGDVPVDMIKPEGIQLRSFDDSMVPHRFGQQEIYYHRNKKLINKAICLIADIIVACVELIVIIIAGLALLILHAFYGLYKILATTIIGQVVVFSVGWYATGYFTRRVMSRLR